MRVLYATAEVYPLAKTGGLADAARGYAMALKRRGIDVQLILPGYPSALKNIEKAQTVARLPPSLGIDDGLLLRGLLPQTKIPVWLVVSQALFERGGGPYQDDQGCDWTDNAYRFAYFAHAARRLATGRCGIPWWPDVVHANDWHTGLLPLLLTYEASADPATLFTVHNMAFQGNFPKDLLPLLELPDDALACVDFHGQISFLKAGLCCADRVTTVSPTYAKEVLSPEHGCGMDEILRSRSGRFSGILNGIEETAWNPAADAFLPSTYSVKDRSGKGVCKLALQRTFGLSETTDVPLFGFVSRLTTQKMADIILEALPWIAALPLQFVLMGKGDREIEIGLLKAALHEAENALTAYGQEQQRRTALQATVARNRAALDLARQRYKSGVTSFLNVLDAERNLQQSELALAQSTATVSTDLVALYKALGGGWDAGPSAVNEALADAKTP